MATPCQICEQNPSKYKCPGCRVRYCSVRCFQTHKTTVEDGKTEPCSGKRTRGGEKEQEMTTGTLGTAKKLKPTQEGRSQGLPPGQYVSLEEEEEDEHWLLSGEEREKLKGCSWLKSAVKDTKLQALLLRIDGAEDRERELNFHRKNPQFDEFVTKLLQVVDPNGTEASVRE
ncbi:unnamed protein product [Chrysoparadoxa australica]